MGGFHRFGITVFSTAKVWLNFHQFSQYFILCNIYADQRSDHTGFTGSRLSSNNDDIIWNKATLKICYFYYPLLVLKNMRSVYLVIY